MCSFICVLKHRPTPLTVLTLRPFRQFFESKAAIMLSEPRARVLCVDDDEESRDLLSALMRFSGIEVEAVATAAQALSLIEEERFDLYVLDACLPDLGGFELCRRLHDRDSQTPILFFSSAGDAIDKRRGIEAGANAYAIKPDVYELFGSIAQFVLYAENDADRVIGVGRDKSFSLAPQP